MQLTKVIHYGSSSNASRRSDIEHFVVMNPDGDVFDDENVHIYLVFPLRFLSAISSDGTKNVPLGMRLSLDHIHGLIRSNSLTPKQTYEHIFTGDGVPDLGKFKWKECSYQAREFAGLRCTAAHPRDRAEGVTTAAICQSCELPSTDVLCDELVHPVVTGDDVANRMTARHFVESKCNIGSAEFKDETGCVPQTYSCWRKTFTVVEADASGPPAGLLSQVDHINTVVHGKFGTALFKFLKAETILTLKESTQGKDAFKSKLQALGRLIEQMEGQELASASGIVPADEGSINGLSAFLSSVGVADVASVIQPMRDIMTVRVSWSHDVTKQDVISAYGRLGTPLPIQDYDHAWGQIEKALFASLLSLETGLP